MTNKCVVMSYFPHHFIKGLPCTRETPLYGELSCSRYNDRNNQIDGSDYRKMGPTCMKPNKDTPPPGGRDCAYVMRMRWEDYNSHNPPLPHQLLLKDCKIEIFMEYMVGHVPLVPCIITKNGESSWTSITRSTLLLGNLNLLTCVTQKMQSPPNKI